MPNLVIDYVRPTRGYNCSLRADMGKFSEASCGSCTKKSQLCRNSCLLYKKEEEYRLS